LVPSKN